MEASSEAREQSLDADADRSDNHLNQSAETLERIPNEANELPPAIHRSIHWDDISQHSPDTIRFYHSLDLRHMERISVSLREGK
jgi:hypothetical protein